MQFYLLDVDAAHFCPDTTMHGQQQFLGHLYFGDNGWLHSPTTT